MRLFYIFDIDGYEIEKYYEVEVTLFDYVTYAYGDNEHDFEKYEDEFNEECDNLENDERFKVFMHDMYEDDARKECEEEYYDN